MPAFVPAFFEARMPYRRDDLAGMARGCSTAAPAENDPDGGVIETSTIRAIA